MKHLYIVVLSSLLLVQHSYINSTGNETEDARSTLTEISNSALACVKKAHEYVVLPVVRNVAVGIATVSAVYLVTRYWSKMVSPNEMYAAAQGLNTDLATITVNAQGETKELTVGNDRLQELTVKHDSERTHMVSELVKRVGLQATKSAATLEEIQEKQTYCNNSLQTVATTLGATATLSADIATVLEQTRREAHATLEVVNDMPELPLAWFKPKIYNLWKVHAEQQRLLQESDDLTADIMKKLNIPRAHNYETGLIRS